MGGVKVRPALAHFQVSHRTMARAKRGRGQEKGKKGVCNGAGLSVCWWPN